MRNLINFIARYSHLALFVLLEAMSITLLLRSNSYQHSVWFTSANGVAGKVGEWSSSVESFFHLVDINYRLTARNIMLEQRITALEQRLEAAGDTTATTATTLGGDSYSCIPAKVVGNTLHRKDNFITIDRGEADGVRPDMGVVGGNGIVGTVYMTSQHHSVVISLLNSHSNISVAIKRRGYYGYLHWTGGDPTRAYVDDVPRHARFALGDILVTSGYSAIFPEGLLVGQVEHVYNSADGLSYRIGARLATDFGNLRDVMVIDDERIRHQAELMRAAADSLRIKDDARP